MWKVVAAAAIGLGLAASSAIAEQADAYNQGIADWRGLKAWVDSQTGDRRAGADYWAANRNVPGHAPCAEAAEHYAVDDDVSGMFLTGCQEAKRRLDPIDDRRRNPQYRAGFADEAKRLPLYAGTAPPPGTLAPAPPAATPPTIATPRAAPVTAGILTINNHSCLRITEVKIDDTPQVGTIGPGDTVNFNMDNRCFHIVHGTSYGTYEWTTHIQCQGLPYEHFTVNWAATNRPPAAISLAEDSLIVEKVSRDNFGEIRITSKMECITIENLVANRGNCNVSQGDRSETLKFGQTLTSNYFCEKLLELNVTTDQGNELFKWDQ